MKMILCLLFLFTSNLWSSTELDQRLQQYVSAFQLKPMTPAPTVNRKLFLLGRELFFEKALSGNHNISCADCHHPMTMTHDRLPLAIGEGASGIETSAGGRIQSRGKLVARNSPALFNLHNVNVLFWDGRVSFDPLTGGFKTPGKVPEDFWLTLKSPLAVQALFPLVNHVEMRGQVGTNEIADAKSDEEAWSLLMGRVLSNGHYKKTLEELFPGQKLNLGHVAEAIAHFESTAFYAADTAYDRYLKGELTAMTEIQKIGMDVFFNKGRCGSCHRGEHLSDFTFHNIGAPQIGPGKEQGDDFGRFEHDPHPANLYAFRVPGLRNVAMTAPYMHDGAFKTLAQVIEHYDDIEGSLLSYEFVNNYKNYVEPIPGSHISSHEARLAALSPMLFKRLEFEESEEKALAEFLRGALTEKRFLEAEISEDYSTTLRIQLTEAGFEKLHSTLPEGFKQEDKAYFYFDVFNQEGYRLRELEFPVKLFFTQTKNGTELQFKRQLFKASQAFSGIIGAGSFDSSEILALSSQAASDLAELNSDFFQRLYAYMSTSEIPEIERQVMKRDVELMNEIWHQLKFKNQQTISDEMNLSWDKLFFAPTSSNTKTEYTWTGTINGEQVTEALLASNLRNERGEQVKTWAIELSLNRITKKQLPTILTNWLEGLKARGLLAEDARGTTPSPSKLTEKILLDLFP